MTTKLQKYITHLRDILLMFSVLGILAGSRVWLGICIAIILASMFIVGEDRIDWGIDDYEEPHINRLILWRKTSIKSILRQN